jgi:NitT/TauT family transport system substrate-binding protein
MRFKTISVIGMFLGAAALVGAALTTFSAPAMSQTRIRFALDWSPGSYHTPFLIALYKGYYKAEGLDVTIDRGKGSAEVVRQLASGVYEMGHPDINVIINFNARNPAQAFPMVMMGYEQIPSGIFALKKSGITKPAELEGHTLGATVNDSTFRLWPLFAKHANFDHNKVQIKSIDPSLREALLAKGEVDSITGQVFRSMLDLRARGVPDDQVVGFMYKDYGLDLYGNGVAVSRSFMRENPEAVKGFLRATIKGVKDMISDPKMAIEMLVRYEPLVNPQIEAERLKLALSCCIYTDNVRKGGYGGVDMERLKRSIALVVQGDNLPRSPAPEEVFDASFLPPVADRKLQ